MRESENKRECVCARARAIYIYTSFRIINTYIHTCSAGVTGGRGEKWFPPRRRPPAHRLPRAARCELRDARGDERRPRLVPAVAAGLHRARHQTAEAVDRLPSLKT